MRFEAGKRFMAVLCMLFVAAGLQAEDARAAYIRGAELEKSKQYAQAIDAYQAVLAAQPSFARAHKQIGNCYYYLGDRPKALEHYETYLAATPNDTATQNFATRLRASLSTPAAGSTQAAVQASATPAVKKNAIYTNPVADAMGTFNLGYTRVFGQHNALIVEGAVASMSLGSTAYNLQGGGLGWHFTTRGIEGWFIGPKFQYFVVNVTQTSNGVNATAKGTASGYGAEAGYQWVWDSGFLLNLGLGAEMININVDASATNGTASVSATANFSGVIPTGLLNVGYAF